MVQVFQYQLGDILSGKIPFVSWQGIGCAPGGFVERIGKDLYPFYAHLCNGSSAIRVNNTPLLQMIS